MRHACLKWDLMQDDLKFPMLGLHLSTRITAFFYPLNCFRLADGLPLPVCITVMYTGRLVERRLQSVCVASNWECAQRGASLHCIIVL